MDTSSFSIARPRLLIGMVHLAPLPGAPAWQGSMARVIDRACRDAATLAQAGFDAVLVENFGDAPFYPEQVPPETVAGLTLAAARVAAECGLPMGINVLRNDAHAALAIAAVVGAAFIRVNVHSGALLTDQGWLTGRAHQTLRQRRNLGASVAICADVLVKHSVLPPDADAGEFARDTRLRAGADVLIVTGSATGATADLARVHAVRAALPGAPLWIGSGIDRDNIRSFLDVATGVIVGTSIKEAGETAAPVDLARATALVEAARR